MLSEVAAQKSKAGRVRRQRSIMSAPKTKEGGPCNGGIQPCATHQREQPESNFIIWRPWILTPEDGTQKIYQETNRLNDNHRNFLSAENSGFQHPVRLYLPKSKCHEYLTSTGIKILASFPVQATINFYNDNSDSADDDDGERNDTL